MILADVLKYVFLVIGTLVVIVSYWLVTTALFPATVERTREAYGAHPVRITLVGTLCAIPLLLVGVALLSGAPNAVLKVVGGLLAALPVVLGLAGSAGLSDRVGRGLVHAEDGRTPWRRSLRGGVVLALTFLLPVIGWFVVLPWVLLSGCGATISALR
ncbi:MAG: hypothetical protein IT360_07360, partial [Gemmatimonadaceae bacterium]|nr:hypothetical protein [Gemmatimonadaceae bacterium]